MTKRLRSKVRMLRDHGQSKKYYHDVEGYNGRLDSIQAEILRVKLKHLARLERAAPRECARSTTTCLNRWEKASRSLRSRRGPSRSIISTWSARTTATNLQKHLTDAGIGTGIHYPIPVHLQGAYASFGWKRGDFPVSEEAADQILSLPMFAGLHANQQQRVAGVVAEFASVQIAK